MRRRRGLRLPRLLLLLACGLTAQPEATSAFAAQDPPKPAPPTTVTGKWTMSMDIENMGAATTALEFKQDGEKLTGTYTGRYGAFKLEGTLEARKIAFTVYLVAEGQESTMYFEGEVAEDVATMRGQGSIEGMGAVAWSAKRSPITGTP
jgi:hypothetical protein